MKKTLIKNIFSLSLCLLTILNSLILPSSASLENEKPLLNKTISILGDSISTFHNYSNGDAALTTNSTIKNNRCFYTDGKFDVNLEDTWWYQVAEKTGGRILVNNSYSNGSVYSPTSDSSLAYLNRCVNLHDNTGENAGEEPDIIAVFLGTNDFSYCTNALGSSDEIDYKKLIVKTSKGYKYATPTNNTEAYAIMIHKIITRYQNAEVYCFTVPMRSSLNASHIKTLEAFNNSIIDIASHFDCNYVDLYNYSGITDDERIIARYYGDGYVHPTVTGMNSIANCFLSSFYENSEYIPKSTKVHSIDYNTYNVILNEDTLTSILNNSAFKSSVTRLKYGELNVKVSMGGKDITNSCYNNGIIYIPKVTDNIKIFVTVNDISRDMNSYRFLNTENSFTSTDINENTFNNLTKFEKGNSAYYGTSTSIELYCDKEWSVTFNGVLDALNNEILLSTYENSLAEGNISLSYDRNTSLLSFNEIIDGEHYSYGILLSHNDIDTNTAHTYNLSNNVNNDYTSDVHLYVDGKEIGEVNLSYIDGKYNKVINNWFTDKEMIFNYIGTSDKPINPSAIRRLQVWEDAKTDSHTHLYEPIYTVESSCAEKGYTAFLCDCNASYNGNFTDTKPHKLSQWYTASTPSVYAPGVQCQKCSVCNNIVNKKYTPQLKCQKPTPSRATNTSSGVKVEWPQVAGADSYRVYRRTAKGNWFYLKNVATNYYYDNTAKSNTTYYYTVRAVNEAGYSAYDTNGIKHHVLHTPTITKKANVSNGIKLSWNTVPGATGYYVFRKEGAYWRYKATVSTTSYTDTNTKYGYNYLYRIQAYNSIAVSGFDLNGISVKRLATPKLNKIYNTTNGLTISWNTVAGANGYYIYRKSGTGTWKYIGKAGITNTYTDVTAASGCKYTYTVRAFSGTSISLYDYKGLTYMSLTPPKLNSAQNGINSIKVTWSKVTGATGYYVYRKTENGKWEYIGRTTNTYFKDADVKNNKKYTYTVRAYNGNYFSSYNIKGKSVIRISGLQHF